MPIAAFVIVYAFTALLLKSVTKGYPLTARVDLSIELVESRYGVALNMHGY